MDSSENTLFQVDLSFSGGVPRLQIGSRTEQEAATDGFDTQAMKWLGWLMVPLCVGGAVYRYVFHTSLSLFFESFTVLTFSGFHCSLLFVPHKSWYSWCVESLANGVYAFGFLFMLPQLFVNYKLKSVAHLPWRAFMYKVTFTL